MPNLSSSPRHARRDVAASLAACLFSAVAGLALSACDATPRDGSRAEAPRARATLEHAITIDGNTEDWPGGVVALADKDYVYLRFAAMGEPTSIQSAEKTTSIMLDVDADASTGWQLGGKIANLGIDLELQASPAKPAGGTATGVSIFSVDSSGFTLPLSRGDFDVAMAPTYASTWYEVRIARTPDNPGNLPVAGLLSRGNLRGVFALKDGDGKLVGVSDPFVVALADAAPQKPLTGTLPPKKPEDAIRVMSFNVEKSGPVEKPEPFRRILDVLQPDVILFQEWDQGSPGDIAQWLAAADRGTAWYVAKPVGQISQGGGVIVASRFPVLKSFGGLKADDKPVRAVGAVLDSPVGPILATSVHLKCCGSAGSSEDIRRREEARVVNAAADKAATEAGAAIRIIAGDFNLVGSRPPLDIMRHAIDADGSDLTIAEVQALGAGLVETWSDEGNAFAPGRLDYMLLSDSSVVVKNAFVFNTRRMTIEALAKLGVDGEDSSASDHMPIVVDVVAR